MKALAVGGTENHVHALISLPSTLTVAKAIQAYLAELGLAGRSPRTVSCQTWLLQTFAKAIGDRPIDSITRTDVTTYLGAMAARRLSQSYIGINGKTIKRFFNWAVEQGILKSNPLQGMRIGMGPDKPFAPFTDDECRPAHNDSQTG